MTNPIGEMVAKGAQAPHRIVQPIKQRLGRPVIGIPVAIKDIGGEIMLDGLTRPFAQGGVRLDHHVIIPEEPQPHDGPISGKGQTYDNQSVAPGHGKSHAVILAVLRKKTQRHISPPMIDRIEARMKWGGRYLNSTSDWPGPTRTPR